MRVLEPWLIQSEQQWNALACEVLLIMELVQILQVRAHYAGTRRNHSRRGLLVEINPSAEALSATNAKASK